MSSRFMLCCAVLKFRCFFFVAIGAFPCGEDFRSFTKMTLFRIIFAQPGQHYPGGADHNIPLNVTLVSTRAGLVIIGHWLITTR
jgi:hypothetical protein